MLFRSPANLKLFCRVIGIYWAIASAGCGLARSQSVPAGPVEQGTRIVSAQEVESTFPASVFFKGKTAPVQWRNASAVRFSDGSLLFAGLIDSSGYASSVQETYQMYLLVETTVMAGDKSLPAGSYGAGFVGDRFIVMDIGGHTITETAINADGGLIRPRPLQFLQPGPSDVRLYLGRRWVSISLPPTAK